MVIDEYPTESPGKCIKIPHGADGCKTVGLVQPYPYHSAQFADLMTYVISTSKGTVDITARSAGVDKDRVLPYGRTMWDTIIGKHKGDGGTDWTNYRVYYYQPTYRGGNETPLPEINWQWLDDNLTDDELLTVRSHPMSGKVLDREYKHIREYDHELPYTPYLIDCDVMITDYSSSMIDAYIVNKPVVLFEKTPGYTKTRGMYFDYPYQYCSRYAASEPELLEQARTAKRLSKTETDCRQLLASAGDGHTCERICELIESMA
jgi:CDP-glycerol glycerophosphotransferase (TagB/SpsB family)